MDDVVQDLLKIANSIQNKHKDNFSFFSISALSSKNTFLVADSESNFDFDEELVCEYGLEPILSKLKSEYLSEKEILELVKNAKTKIRSDDISNNVLIHAIAHEQTGLEFVAFVQSNITNRLLCSKLGSKPFLGHIFEDSVIHCGKTVAAIPYVESGFFLAKTVAQELKNYKKQHFLSPKVLLMENRGHIILAETKEAILKTIHTLENWSELLSNIFSFSSPKYLSHEQIIDIEKNNRDRLSFFKNQNSD